MVAKEVFKMDFINFCKGFVFPENKIYGTVAFPKPKQSQVQEMIIQFQLETDRIVAKKCQDRVFKCLRN